jgi:hypothetical protein
MLYFPPRSFFRRARGIDAAVDRPVRRFTNPARPRSDLTNVRHPDSAETSLGPLPQRKPRSARARLRGSSIASLDPASSDAARSRPQSSCRNNSPRKEGLAAAFESLEGQDPRRASHHPNIQPAFTPRESRPRRAASSRWAARAGRAAVRIGSARRPPSPRAEALDVCLSRSRSRSRPRASKAGRRPSRT